MIKTLSKVDLESTYSDTMKAVYDKRTANTTLNREKLKAFPLKPGRRLGCPLSPLLLNTVLGVLATAIRQKEIKGINWKGKSKTVIICSWHDTTYKEHWRFHQKTTKLINEFSKVAGHKINMQKSVVFYIHIMTYLKGKLRKKSHLQLHPKNKGRPGEGPGLRLAAWPKCSFLLELRTPEVCPAC